jgi:hypothetical protein
MLRLDIYAAIVLLFMLVLGNNLYSQVVINEFLASNVGITIDPDYNESSDWIELYNAGNSDVSLAGYYFSDNISDPEKWVFPAGTEIKAGEYLILWADGNNAGLHTNFKLSSAGEELLFSSNKGEALDSLIYGPQDHNISFGRINDNGSEWGYFIEPTLGASNGNENFDGIVRNKPHFTPMGGIYTKALVVEIKNTFGGEVRFTTNGSEPTEQSSLYESPIEINETTILRARIYKSDQIPGDVFTHSYFIDTDNAIGNLPVVSLATEAANFWDSEKGIYVQDSKPDWEVPINIELFENDGSDRAAFNLKAGTKVNGLYSWQLPQKMLGVYFRKDYGKGKLDYPLFTDRDRSRFDSFALRASGSDWAYTLFRDGMSQCLTAVNMEVDFQGFRPVVVFVNGQYMGIHNIRSKVDEDFIIQNHQLDGLDIDMVEWTDDGLYAEAGNTVSYKDFEDLTKAGLSNQANYNAVCKEMDIENFTDYIIAEMAVRNTSLDHNTMAWKPRYGGKWKWILMDLDRGFFSPTRNLIDYYEGKRVVPFGDLLENDGYRQYFGRRLADHLFTTYSPDRVKDLIDQFKTNIEEEMPNHIQRWEGTSSSYGDPISSISRWENNIDNLKSFANTRPNALLNDLMNYGFEASEPLAISIFPANSGTVDFNGIALTRSFNQGAYPASEEIQLAAISKAGFQFKGWASQGSTILVNSDGNWKYFDSGVNLANAWIDLAYNDNDWAEGRAELGYGDGDETTEISYGDDSNNKYITNYFRKKFTVTDVDVFQNLRIDLKCDDGAVVYLNGVEVVRENLPSGTIEYNTTAINAVGGGSESSFDTYQIDSEFLQKGENVIAVEVHQVSGSSSDISFDLKLSATTIGTGDYISTNANYNFVHESDLNVIAVFESDGSCILSENIDNELILTKDCSPYRVPNNVKVAEEGKLIIEQGVELYMSDNVSLTINGSMEVNGTENEPVYFMSNPQSENKKWGILNFVNADTSYLNNVVIEDASKGINPIREIAAISVFNSVIRMDGMHIENVHATPIHARYSDVVLKNSNLHSRITGDNINVKYGKGYIENCRFTGNNEPDSDAIDFDDISNGVIKDCVIHDFHGFNSDGIDIGEEAQNISIENILVYNITDKGVSVGQQSSAAISNSIFVNCNMGAGLKDSCKVTIDHCTYYGNEKSIACFEKNIGDAGGNAVITNSILSNTYGNTYVCDNKSTIKISYSASDNEALPAGSNNLFSNPQFTNPNKFDFSLSPISPCLGAANNGDIGANLQFDEMISQIYISALGYNSPHTDMDLEFIILSNKGTKDIDISGYSITKGVSFSFPEESNFRAGRDIYITNNASSEFWFDKGLNVYQWESGRLADDGEAVKIETPTGIIIDRVRYNENTTWPDAKSGQGIQLIADDLDNHFGSNWESLDFINMVGIDDEFAMNTEFQVYPNPSTGKVFLEGLSVDSAIVGIYTVAGTKVKQQVLLRNETSLDLSNLGAGLYIVKCGGYTQRIVLLDN